MRFVRASSVLVALLLALLVQSLPATVSSASADHAPASAPVDFANLFFPAYLPEYEAVSVSWVFMFDRINDYRRKVLDFADRSGDPVPPLRLDTNLKFSVIDKTTKYPYKGEYDEDVKWHLDADNLMFNERLYRNWRIPRGTSVSEVVFVTGKRDWDAYMSAMRYWGYTSPPHMKVLRDPKFTKMAVAGAYTNNPINAMARQNPTVFIAEFSAEYQGG